MPFFRQAELSRVRVFAAADTGGALLVHGSSGSGKSRFVTEVVRALPNAVECRINPAEAGRPFSGIVAVLAALSEAGVRLARTIAAAHERDPFTVAERILEHLQDGALESSLLVVDDADLADQASIVTLVALVRRLSSTTLRMVLLVSDAGVGPFTGIEAVRLAPIERDQLLALIAEQKRTVAHDAVLDRMLAEGGGMPGPCLALASFLDRRQLQGVAAIPVPMRTGERYALPILERFADLADDAKRALELIVCTPRIKTDAIRSLTSTVALDQLLDCGWISQLGEWTAARDFDVRSAVYYRALDPAARCERHQLLLDASSDDEERAWHASFVSPAPRIAADLRRTALRLLVAGQRQPGLEHLERSLLLKAPTVENLDELLALAEAVFPLGPGTAAVRLVDLAEGLTPQRAGGSLAIASLRLRFQYVSSQVLLSVLAEEALQRDRVAPHARVVFVLALLAIFSAERWELDDAGQYLARLEASTAGVDVAGPGGEGRAATMSENARLLVHAMEGRCALPRAAQIAIDVADTSTATTALLARGRALTYGERYDEARQLFGLVLNSSLTVESPWLTTARLYATDNERRSGNIHGALSAIEPLVRTAGAARALEPFRLFTEYWFHCERGTPEQAESTLDRLFRVLRGKRNSAVSASLDAYLGVRALQLGNLPEASRLLMRCRLVSGKVANPQLARVDADLVEVLLLTGDTANAVAVFADLEDRAAYAPSRWAVLAIARCRAMLAPPGELARSFDELLTRFGPADSDYEYARTLSAYAGQLDLLQLTPEAAHARASAATVFRRIGLVRWAAEVAGTGAADDAADPLSPSERAVVDLVVKGLRNREIASALFVSVRAVESRLTAVYRKLGVHSRAQLTAAIRSV